MIPLPCFASFPLGAVYPIKFPLVGGLRGKAAMIFPLGHQSKLTMFLQNASISTNLISLSLLRLWKQ